MAKYKIFPSKHNFKRGAATFVVVDDCGEHADGRVTWSIRKKGGGAKTKPQALLVDGSTVLDAGPPAIIVTPAALPAPGEWELSAVVHEKGREPEDSEPAQLDRPDLPVPTFVTFAEDGRPGEPPPPPNRVEVTLGRTHVAPTRDQVLWVAIRASTNQLRFSEYQDFIDELFLSVDAAVQRGGRRRLQRPAGEVDLISELGWLVSNFGAYAFLKRATEVFVMSRCGVIPGDPLVKPDLLEEAARFGYTLPKTFSEMWADYLEPYTTRNGATAAILPYLDLIRRKLGDVAGPRTAAAGIVDSQIGLLQEKLVFPCMLELIWSYWHEEGMLVQAMNAISQRFQNVRSPGMRDPLAQLEIDSLRPLNQLLWGLVQDEPNRLSVLRRAHEYDHHYGFTLHGKATADMRSADRRSKFLESFHHLLLACHQFYRQDDDTTVIADGFPVLNAIKETHYLLSHGAHNQFGDLPATARQEMLVQQYVLSRPEMREFLGGRAAVPYPEPWMDRVDALKNLKGWTDVSVVHFRDLGVFGEQIVLSVRYGDWSLVDEPQSAANWARYWRAEVQGYIHAYRAVTGVDLSSDVTSRRNAQERNLPPAVHLKNRLFAQQGLK